MELSKIQKKLDPKVLEEGRQISKKIYYPTAIWFFAIGPFVFYLVSLTDFGENFYSSEGWHAFFIVFFLWGAPNIFCVYHLFTNPSAKYFKVISNTFKINIWFMRPFTKEEITFISKHFKKQTHNVLQNIIVKHLLNPYFVL